LELARDVLDELTVPYYPVLGNHDALFSGEKEETLFCEVFSLKENSYHFAHRGIQFIGIDHGCGRGYNDNSVRPAVMDWLKKTLVTIPDDQPIIFFSHYPFAKGVKYRTKNADAVHELFKSKKLLAMISGHFHGNTERRENGVLMTTTACSSGTRNNHDRTKPKGYRTFRVDKEMNITTEFKEVSV
jgi:3',5'-cyclic AMP phosphodiesterase CpdA